MRKLEYAYQRHIFRYSSPRIRTIYELRDPLWYHFYWTEKYLHILYLILASLLVVVLKINTLWSNSPTWLKTNIKLVTLSATIIRLFLLSTARCVGSDKDSCVKSLIVSPLIVILRIIQLVKRIFKQSRNVMAFRKNYTNRVINLVRQLTTAIQSSLVLSDDECTPIPVHALPFKQGFSICLTNIKSLVNTLILEFPVSTTYTYKMKIISWNSR